jgi:hypothetical protein
MSESPIKIGKIFSTCLQYRRKAFEDQRPCFITTQGSTPESKRFVVPPIRKLWPVKVGKSCEDHIELQRAIKDFRRRGEKPIVVLKANKGASFGTS